MSQTEPLTDLLRREIAAGGPLPFTRFMELALYAPGLGYYERERGRIGRHGDFHTSVSVGSLFGELLARQFIEWFEASPASCASPAATLQLVEAGAHDGQLAADVLCYLEASRARLFSTLEYWIVEPSARRQGWQQETLAGFGSRVRWASGMGSVPRGAFRIVFCNELLDAMPVRRLGWDASAHRWFEWGVGWDGQRFVWVRLTLPNRLASPALSSLGASGLFSSDLLKFLPDGYTVELCPTAEAWWREAATHLGTGVLAAIDYGLTEDELLQPERPWGTLRGFRENHQSRDLLADPGQQDLTAHVDFTALRRTGEDAKLRTVALLQQSQFLTRIASRIWLDPDAPGQWMPKQTSQFRTLIHPEHFGRAFRVLIQCSGDADVTVSGEKKDEKE